MDGVQARWRYFAAGRLEPGGNSETKFLDKGGGAAVASTSNVCAFHSHSHNRTP